MLLPGSLPASAYPEPNVPLGVGVLGPRRVVARAKDDARAARLGLLEEDVVPNSYARRPARFCHTTVSRPTIVPDERAMAKLRARKA